MGAGIITFVHVITCALLVTIILMQSGRGGGLTESFASAESMFGAKTNVLLIRTTTVLATFFLITSLVLAVVNARRDESLMANKIATQTQDQAQDVSATMEQKTEQKASTDQQ